MNQKPLSHIRVVELANMVAAPSCGRILAYMGAEVIKVEPLEGEFYRTYTPYSGGEPVVFDLLNAQKKSVVFNAKDPEVHEYLQKLLGTADVFLSNVRADGLGRLGLGYEQVKAINSRLVYAHFSGYGEKGDMAKLPGYDVTAFLVRDGIYRDFTAPENEPNVHIPGFGDLMSGQILATNILGALMKADRTGEGEKIEVSLCQTGAWVMALPMIYEQFGSWYQRANGDPPDASNTNIKCGDGEWIFYSCGTTRQWHNFCRAAGREDLIADPRCANADAILQNSKSLYDDLSVTFLKHGAEEWVKILREYDVPCERHRHVRELAEDEQLFANNYTYRAKYPTKTVTMPLPPVQFGSVDLACDARGTTLGADTEDILQSLGCPAEKIAQLEEKGVIIGRK